MHRSGRHRSRAPPRRSTCWSTTRVSRVEHLTDAVLTRQFDTNVLGVVRMVRALAPAMRARRSGTIINLSSVAGQISAPYTGAYAASKRALEAICEALWFELRSFGVRVVIIEPGASTPPSATMCKPPPALTTTRRTPRWLDGSQRPWRRFAPARRRIRRRSPI